MFLCLIIFYCRSGHSSLHSGDVLHQFCIVYACFVVYELSSFRELVHSKHRRRFLELRKLDHILNATDGVFV